MYNICSTSLQAEQCDIRQEVQTVIQENTELNMQLKNALCVKASINFSTTSSDEVDNLKEQIQLINKVLLTENIIQ